MVDDVACAQSPASCCRKTESAAGTWTWSTGDVIEHGQRFLAEQTATQRPATRTLTARSAKGRPRLSEATDGIDGDLPRCKEGAS